jgi:peptidoglycan glycosyltransferase
VNRPIVRLYGLLAVLFALLIAFTSRWTVFEASSLRNNKLNARLLLEQQRINRGPILAANGATIARSVRGGEGIYQRIYPFGSLFGNAIGFSFTNPDLGATGVERYRNDDLNGRNSGNLQSVLDQLQGKEPAGDRVLTTLDPAAQRVAEAQLAGHEGAVVALEPRSGAVTVMASSPSYNPNGLRSSGSRAQIEHAAGNPLVNRAVQFGYAPGSTFKVITATAAIDTGKYTAQSTVSGRNDLVVSGLALQNDNNESLGQITLIEALAKSVNTVWAQVAEHVGKPTLARYMERFGFGHTPQLDYPADEMSASGPYRNGRLISPTSPYVDLGRMGIGQDKLEVTPLQMAEVAAAVANQGRLMSPHIAGRIVDSEGRLVTTVGPHLQSVVMKPSTAASVRTMMEAVVNEGTGTTAQIPGVQVAGKTGTAETQIGTAINNVWFIAFAPAANPRVAIAATLRRVPGQGAAFAAPIARAVIERLLHD